jgi:hypothetical protein
MILSIDSWQCDADAGTVFVVAVLDDAQASAAGPYDAPEPLAGLCTTTVLCEPEDWPASEQEQKEWLESYEPNWLLASF